MKEEFLAFLKVTDLSGSGLAKIILATLKDSGLDLNRLVGQGYDGAASMSGCNKGVQVC